MSYELRVHDDGTSACHRCGGSVERKGVERVEDIAFLPLRRRYRMLTRCTQCRWHTNTRITDRLLRERIGRTAGLRWRIGGTWLVMLLGIAGAVLWHQWLRERHRERVLAPMVGDLWTIDTTRWPSVVPDENPFENAAKYARVRVVGVTDTEIEVGACNTTSDDKDTVEKHCKTFREAFPAVERRRLAELAKDDAVHDSDRDGDSARQPWFILIAWGAVAGVAILFGRAFRKRRGVQVF